MTPTLWALTFLLMTPADPPAKSDPPRKPNPFAPSLRLLTEDEEAQLDQIIDRFIQFDTGKLRGAEGQKAVAEFQKLGPDAIPALIRGINRAAKIEYSCPAVTIGRKLAALLKASHDPELLDFARENIGAGVTQSRHMNVLKDLRVTCMLRKRVVAQRAVTLNAAPPPADLPTMTTSQLLAEAVTRARGTRRDSILRELDSRKLEDVLPDLGAVAADDSSPKQQKMARDLLDRSLGRLTAKNLKAKLSDEQPEVRASAARVAAQKGWHLEKDLVDLLEDANTDVRQAAHKALVRLNPRIDFGPKDDTDEMARTAAVRKWRDWLARQGGR